MLSAIFATALLAAVSADDAIALNADWKRLPAGQESYFIYFTTADVPVQMRGPVEKALKFEVPSASRAVALNEQIPQRISDTLWRVDLRGEQWEYSDFYKAIYGYPYSKLQYPRLISAIWFVYQLANTNHSNAYYLLIYSSKNEPKTGKDFLKFWGDDGKAADLEVGFINDGHGVSVAGRRDITWKKTARTEQLSQTKDVLEIEVGKDPLDALGDAKRLKFDGQEFIASIPKRATGVAGAAQVYFLANGQDKRIEKALNDLVEDHQTTFGHHTIYNNGSCVSCHTDGMQPVALDAYKAYLVKDGKKAGRLVTADFEEKRRIEARFQTGVSNIVKRASEDYSFFVEHCNGLTAPENAVNFAAVLNDFNAPVGIDRASTQLYTTPSNLRSAIAYYQKHGYGKDTTDLTTLHDGGTVARKKFDQKVYWDLDAALDLWGIRQ